MEIHYCVDSAWILEKPQGNAFLQMLREAGVTNVWLYGYFYGHFWNLLSDMIKAKNILEQAGFQVGAACLPVGHPGNSLDPDDSTIDLQIPSHWRYRINRKGKPVHFCADIEEKMIASNVEAIHQLKAAGFSQILWDDDLRFGNAGSELQGCFCDACIEDFNQRFRLNVTRDQLSRDIQMKLQSEMLSQWAEFICSKMTEFIQSMAIRGIIALQMVMYHGDERHGINIGKIRESVPQIQFRVGEEHFSDRRFISVQGKIEEIMAIQSHLVLMRGAITYSETTTFPFGSLSPQNWLLKAKYALALGVDHLFLMCGTSPFPAEYWHELQNHMPEFLPLSVSQNHCPREYPVHVAFGSRMEWQEPIEAPQFAHMMGLPATVMQANETKGSEILFLSHLYKIGEEWLAKLPKYRIIFYDKRIPIESQQMLKKIGRDNSEIKMYKYDSIDYCKMAPNSLFQSIFRKNYLKKFMKIRQTLMAQNPTYPLLSKGGFCIVIWLKSAVKCILLNLIDSINEISLYFNKKEKDLTLNPLEIRGVHLENW